MDEKQIITLLKKAGCSKSVIRHCRVVAERARAIAHRIPTSAADLAFEGGLLHDIGRSKTHSVRHAYEGALIGRELGLNKAILGIIRNHLGAGLTAAEAAALGLPAEDFIPVTLEEKIVCHADSLTADTMLRTLAETVRDLEDKNLTAAAERTRAMHAELSALAGEDIDTILTEEEQE